MLGALMVGAFIMISASALSMHPPHNFHFSRTEAQWNPESNTVQVTMRLDTDELELALQKHQGLPEAFRIWLGDDQEWPEANSAIYLWVTDHLSIHVAGTDCVWNWVGKEVELDVTYLYLESQPVDGKAAEWRIDNTLFLDQELDQVNEVHVHGTNSRGEPCEKREVLNVDLTHFVWESGLE